ncbi:50S ribosomal protein L2 [Candidatus Nasuia deltocephalinicola]|uniref:50S ribosomal protein L2 n=1 Tax=Candidatus Nasuia deltocephalincola TaxID=1160784 RepID=UPI00216B657E|nr:50S ribosomal protein L2 [Candidatus Nasuia deltocephalinicola]
MVLFKFKPKTSGTRNKVKIFNNLYKFKFFKKNSKILKSSAGRNNKGTISVRHIGGRFKRKYRYVDFFRNKDNILGIVERVEYDPNRNSNISLILYSDGERRYIISPKNLFISNTVISSFQTPLKIGNTLCLKYIPLGIKIHCVESKPGKGGTYSRAAGSYCIIISNFYDNVIIMLKSGLLKKISFMCRATIGEVGNSEHFLIRLGKAGCKRHLGIRPTVRGVAMNPVDHPHGGGEGKSSGGRDPVSPWGRLSKPLKKNV